MESFGELLTKAETAHGHLCAGQILGRPQVHAWLLGFSPESAGMIRIETT
jgi:hypothetical protein